MRNGFEMYACIVCRFYDRRQRLFHLFVTILLYVSRAHTPNRIAILEILRVAPKPQLTKKKKKYHVIYTVSNIYSYSIYPHCTVTSGTLAGPILFLFLHSVRKKNQKKKRDRGGGLNVNRRQSAPGRRGTILFSYKQTFYNSADRYLSCAQSSQPTIAHISSPQLFRATGREQQ